MEIPIKLNKLPGLLVTSALDYLSMCITHSLHLSNRLLWGGGDVVITVNQVVSIAFQARTGPNGHALPMTNSCTYTLDHLPISLFLVKSIAKDNRNPT